jgi:hypothetical protein
MWEPITHRRLPDMGRLRDTRRHPGRPRDIHRTGNMGLDPRQRLSIRSARGSLVVAGSKHFLSRQQQSRRLGEFGPVTTILEQVPVHVQRHDDGRMPEQVLHHLGRQLTAAAFLRIDAP